MKKHSLKATLQTTLLFLSLGYISVATAVPPGMIINFTKSPMGLVTFSGTLHAEKGLTCDNCHTDIFQKKKGTTQITMSDHAEGKKYCYTCHNGTKAFKTKGNCGRCHKR